MVCLKWLSSFVALQAKSLKPNLTATGKRLLLLELEQLCQHVDHNGVSGFNMLYGPLISGCQRNHFAVDRERDVIER